MTWTVMTALAVLMTSMASAQDRGAQGGDRLRAGLMVEGGMTPAQVLTAATVTSAAFLKMNDHGTLEAGKAADFVVLDGNPLEKIENTRKIAAVYLKGERVEKKFR
jgi:imidazolonepropionase-like amidohydrolase